jgi:HD-like signal output (HDOD) protein
VLERAQREHRPLFEIEQEERGVTHAEVGGQLLGLWGLPDGIVEAVAYHHHPHTVPQPQLDAVAAVAIANALVHECDEDGERAVSTLDEQYVADLGLAGRVAGWREIAAQVVATS